MAEVDIVRSPDVISPRRRGFFAFCAVVLALIAGLTYPLALDAVHHASRPVAPDPAIRGRAEPRSPATDRRDAEPVGAVQGIPRTTFDRILTQGEPIFCGAGTQRIVALTFDDGPGLLTMQTVRLLREHGMTATFFLLGYRAAEPRFGAAVAAAARLGAVGDHTWSHVTTVRSARDELVGQVGRTRREIAERTGVDVALFRPPLGRHDARADRYLRSEGLLTVLWSVDTRDSLGATPDQIFRAVRRSLSPGDIVLLHENDRSTRRALPRILDLIAARRFTTVTVPELLAQDPPTNVQLRQGTCPA